MKKSIGFPGASFLGRPLRTPSVIIPSLRTAAGSKLRVVRGSATSVEDFGGLVVGGGSFALGGDGGLHLGQFLGDHRADHLDGDLAAVVEDALGRHHPLPDLGREISAVAASSIRLWMGTQPLPASQEPR